MEKNLDEKIAVIGMACRLPGNCNTPDEFYNFILEGKDSMVKPPADRWDADAMYDCDSATRSRINSKIGGFILSPINRW